MRKVKGFKLEVRPKEVQRLAKKSGLDIAPIGGPECLAKEIQQVSKLISPAVLYDTFTGSSDADAAAKGAGLAPIPGVAFSVVLATLGGGFASKRRELEEADPRRARLWGLIAQSALAEAVRFAASLIDTEAALENCCLSPLNPLTGSEALASALDRLDCAKIGVSLGDEGLVPADSAVVTLSWLSKSRGRKSKT
ncbi:MAG: hypothetical protein HY748_12915 [Elusimicrobia bacterium]|nr:hypothetical protein [Elusimicrobiota bacterium]